ncbi:hypothetical protein OIO90_005455 [Microbotryomycetes sp. JL221]|nr:hypothetical protein OIO90_005455 [Microbotryomycetes sp. JL221]
MAHQAPVGHVNPYVYNNANGAAGAPPLPPGPPPPPPQTPAQYPGQPSAQYPGYSYAAGYAAAAPPQAAAHPQYPGYGYGNAQPAHNVPQAYAAGAYAQPASNAAYAAAPAQNAYAAYYGAQQPGAPASAYAGYASPSAPPPQQGGATPSYGGARPTNAAFPSHPGPSPQGAPPYKRTRYDSLAGPPPPAQPVMTGGPPPALPPVGRSGPPPPMQSRDRGPPPPPAGGRDSYEDRYRGVSSATDPYSPSAPRPSAGGGRDRQYAAYGGGRDAPPSRNTQPPIRGGRDGYDSRAMPPPPSGRGPPPSSYRGGPDSRYGAPRGDRYRDSRGYDRDRRDRGPRPVDRRDSRRDDRGGRQPLPPQGGALRSSRTNVPNRRDNPRDRRDKKWGTRDSKDHSTNSAKDEAKHSTFLTDFRISGLSIAELEWDWTTEQPTPGAAGEKSDKDEAVKTGDTSVESASKDGSETASAPRNDDGTAAEGDSTTPAEPAAPVKKLSKRQRRTAAKKAAAAAAAAAATTAQADGPQVAEGDANETATATADTVQDKSESEEVTAPIKKDGKHGRDEDDDGEDDSQTEVIAAKKVKADSGEAVTLQNVDTKSDTVKVEPKEEAVDLASSTTQAQEQSDSKGLSSAALAQRENSRLRIYFSSPVSGAPTYGHGVAVESDKKSVAAASDAVTENKGTDEAPAGQAATVAATASSASEHKDESSTLDVTGTVQDGTDAAPEAALTETGGAADVDTSMTAETLPDVDGAPIDGESMSDMRDTNPNNDEEESDSESVVIESALLISSTTAPTIDTDNSSYPPDPYSQGDAAGVAPSIASREHSLAPTDGTHAHAPPPEPSADRMSISYARNTRRMVIDAQVVDKVSIFRAQGRIEVSVQLKPAVNPLDQSASDEFRVCEGILIEALDQETDDFYVIDRFSLEHAWSKEDPVTGDEHAASADTSATDPLLPPLHHLLKEAELSNDGTVKHEGLAFTPGFKRDQITIVAHLDRANPLTEARWVKTGEVEQWIISLGLTNGQDPRKDKLSEWRGKIAVVDPDAPPTIEHTLKSWATSSTIGNFDERKKFIEIHMADIDNVVEILLRLTRGDRPGPTYASASSPSQANSVGVLAATLSAPYPDSQTQVSLAVLAMFRLSVETAEKAGLDKQEIYKQVSDIVRNVPSTLQNKALDGMFKEYRSGGRK